MWKVYGNYGAVNLLLWMRAESIDGFFNDHSLDTHKKCLWKTQKGSRKEIKKMQLKPDGEAIFEFTGSRKNNIYEGYRPSHLIKDSYLTTGIHNYYNLQDENNIELRGTITFISPESYPKSLWIGKKIAMYEGSNVVGYAIITNIFNIILFDDKR